MLETGTLKKSVDVGSCLRTGSGDKFNNIQALKCGQKHDMFFFFKLGAISAICVEKCPLMTLEWIFLLIYRYFTIGELWLKKD